MGKSPLEEGFAERLRRLRTRADYTQEELAEALGRHRNTVGNWENPEKSLPDAKTIARLAELLDVEEEELLGRAPDSWRAFEQGVRRAIDRVEGALLDLEDMLAEDAPAGYRRSVVQMGSDDGAILPVGAPGMFAWLVALAEAVEPDQTLEEHLAYVLAAERALEEAGMLDAASRMAWDAYKMGRAEGPSGVRWRDLPEVTLSDPERLTVQRRARADADLRKRHTP